MRRNILGLYALLWCCAGFSEGVTNAASTNAASTNAASTNAAVSGPSWMMDSEAGVEKNEPVDLKQSAWRSLGALLVVVGGLMGVQYYLRRRSGRFAQTDESQLQVVSRLRLGARQELVVVDWEGDRIILGVGPSTIAPVHYPKPSDSEVGCAEE